MGDYGKGLAYLKQQREAYAARAAKGDGDHMKSYWPNDKEIIQFWFLTDPTEFVVPMVHPIEKARRDGTKYPTDALCERGNRGDPIEDCKYCVGGVKGPWDRPCAYIFVEKIFHLVQPRDGEGKDWKKATRAGSGDPIWIETCAEARFFMMKPAMVEQVESAYYGDPEDTERKPTLFDRPYRVEVTGGKGARRDILQPQDKREMPTAALEMLSALPPIPVTIKDKLGERPTRTLGGTAAADVSFDASDPGPAEPPADEELISFN